MIRKLLSSSDLLDGPSDDAQTLGHVFLGDVEGRDEAQGVVDGRGQDQHVLLHALGLHLGRVALAAHELDREHQPQSSHVVDHVGEVGLGLAQRAHHLLAADVDVLQDLLVLEGLGHGDPGRARHGVAGVRAAHGPGLLRVHELLPRDDAGQGEPVRDPLGHDEDVRAHAVVLDGEHLARPTEPGLDLVDDQQNVVPVADLADSPQVLGDDGDVAAFAEDGLDDDGRRVGRGGFALQQQLQLLDGVHAAILGVVLAVTTVGRDGTLGTVGKGRGEDPRHQRRIVFAVDGLGPCHGHGPESSAVVRTLHDDDILFLSRVSGEFDGGLDGFGPRIPKEECVEGFVWH